ncbi:MAG: riboflavin synthase [Salinarchaeum sp.]
MFTGIVEGTGRIVERNATAEGLRLRIESDILEDLSSGQSIAISGVCLTVEEYGPGWMETFLAEETREVTYLGELAVGDVVNLERAMPADGRFDGHVVQGHVDGTVEVTDVETIDDDWRFTFSRPVDDQYLVSKGSIALDGISLTIAALNESTFEVAIIPETYALTTLSEKSPGDPVHVEYDVIAKYVERMLGESAVADPQQ